MTSEYLNECKPEMFDSTAMSTIRNVALSLLVLTSFSPLRILGQTVDKSSIDLRQDDRATVEAVRSGGLRAAAKMRGTYVTTYSPFDWAQYDAEELAKRSKVVIVAKAISSLCRLSPDGSYITTDFTVSVEQVLKGASHLKLGLTHDLITVKLMGGQVKFDDATSALMLTPGFRKMEIGKRYMLFLSDREHTQSGDLILTGGPQGLFEIGEDSKIKPHGRDFDKVSAYRGTDAGEFIEKVRRAAQAQSDENCCSN